MSDEITVRNVTSDDLDGVMDVEMTWPETMQAPREKFENRLKIFPQGFFIARYEGKTPIKQGNTTFYPGQIVGVTTSEIIRYDGNNHPKTWMDVTDNGWINKTHNPKGNALYVVSVGASLQGKGVGTKLVEAQKALVQKLGLECLILGARCPEYGNPEFNNIFPDEYVHLKRGDGEPRDKEIRFYSRCGLSVVCPMPDYMGKGEDKESRDYGVIMVWKNPEKK